MSELLSGTDSQASSLSTAPKSPFLEEMLHNLDFCDILVLGGDLDPKQECLELNHSELHQRHLDATNSSAGYSIYGKAYCPHPGQLWTGSWIRRSVRNS